MVQAQSQKVVVHIHPDKKKKKRRVRTKSVSRAFAQPYAIPAPPQRFYTGATHDHRENELMRQPTPMRVNAELPKTVGISAGSQTEVSGAIRPKSITDYTKAELQDALSFLGETDLSGTNAELERRLRNYNRGS